jgi:outer membrane protein assembly factor BamB
MKDFSMVMLINVLCLLFSFGCKKDSVVSPTPVTVKNAIVWKYERKYKGLASNNYVYNNLLIQGTAGDGNFELLALTLDSGKLIWSIEGFPRYFDPFNSEYTYCQGNVLMLTHGNYIRTVDLQNGKSLWEDNLQYGDQNTCIIDNYAYKTTSTQQKSELYRYNIQTGQREFLFAVTKLDHGGDIYEPILRMPVKWTDSAGNEHLILHSRGISPHGVWRMDLMSWNLSQKKMDYYHKGVADRASSSRAAIEGNRVYLFSIDKVHCFDAATGNSIWTFERDARDDFSGFKGANVLLVDDKVIAKSYSYWMYGLDKITGKLLWSNDKTSTMPTILREQNDTVWYGSGGVYAVDANTGKVLINGWRYQGKGFWSNAIIPHPSNGTIYATDGEYIYCLDPKYMK